MTNLGEIIKCWRIVNRMGLRETAKILRISHATLSRIERGENCDAKTLTKILTWILRTA